MGTTQRAMVSVVPDALQGRVNAAGGFAASSLAPLGPLLAGVGLATLGNATFFVGAVVTAMTGVPLLASRTIRALGPPATWPRQPRSADATA
ncbi:MAG TPA: hypothetical protein VIG48_02800 [Jatrophihabitans sp.]